MFARLLLCCAAVGLVAAGETFPIRPVEMASGLAKPVALAVAPGQNDRLYVCEQHSGNIKIINTTTRTVTGTYLTVSGLTTGGEQGLLIGLGFAQPAQRHHRQPHRHVGCAHDRHRADDAVGPLDRLVVWHQQLAGAVRAVEHAVAVGARKRRFAEHGVQVFDAGERFGHTGLSSRLRDIVAQGAGRCRPPRCNGSAKPGRGPARSTRPTGTRDSTQSIGAKTAAERTCGGPSRAPVRAGDESRRAGPKRAALPSWLPDADDARALQPGVASREGECVRTGGGRDQAVCGIAVKRGRQLIDCDDDIAIERQYAQHSLVGGANEPIGERQRQIEPAPGVQHLRLPHADRRECQRAALRAGVERGALTGGEKIGRAHV